MVDGKMQKIMIIEDAPAIREELALLLENEGYRPLRVTDYNSIPEQAARERPDLILLDIGLPGQDGFSLCAALRKALQLVCAATAALFLRTHNPSIQSGI